MKGLVNKQRSPSEKLAIMVLMNLFSCECRRLCMQDKSTLGPLIHPIINEMNSYKFFSESFKLLMRLVFSLILHIYYKLEMLLL